MLVSSSSSSSSKSFYKDKDSNDIKLIFPDAGGIDGHAIELLESIMINDYKDANDTFSSTVDWKEHKCNAISTSFES